MASFQTHVTTGLVVGYAAGTLAVVNQWFVSQFTPLLMLVAAFVGSFLPDLDSDHGKPFRIIFSLFSITGGCVAFYYFLQNPRIPRVYWLLIPPAVTLIIRYGVGKIFQKFTTHRGIFHSIPALGIATCATPLAVILFPLATKDIMAISCSVGLGFLSHLVLDEVYSTVNFDGMKFVPKKSLGTALAFTAPSEKVTLAAYVLLAALVVYNWPLLTEIVPGLNFV